MLLPEASSTTPSRPPFSRKTWGRVSSKGVPTRLHSSLSGHRRTVLPPGSHRWAWRLPRLADSGRRRPAERLRPRGGHRPDHTLAAPGLLPGTAIDMALPFTGRRCRGVHLEREASSVISGTPPSALLTGHPALASAAYRWNPASSSPGTRPTVTRAILVMVGAPSTRRRVTVASVCTDSGGVPALARMLDRAIEKQEA